MTDQASNTSSSRVLSACCKVPIISFQRLSDTEPRTVCGLCGVDVDLTSADARQVSTHSISDRVHQSALDPGVALGDWAADRDRFLAAGWGLFPQKRSNSMCNQSCENCSKGCVRVTDLDVAEAGVQPSVQAATQEAILAELKAIRELLEAKEYPLLVSIAG